VLKFTSRERKTERRDSMATKVTAKKPLTGNKRSHSLRATKRQQKVNLQTLTLEDGTKVRTSTREMRTLRKNKSA